MSRPKHPKTTMFTPTLARWLVRARTVVQLATAIVTLIGAIAALLARFGLFGVR